MELNSNQNWIGDFFDQAPCAYVVIDQKGMVQAWNQKAKALFGITSDSLAGAPWSAFLSSDLNAEELIKQRIALSQSVFEEEHPPVSCFREDGTEFEAELVLSPLSLSSEQFFVARFQELKESHREEKSSSSSAILPPISKFEQPLFSNVPNHLKADASTTEVFSYYLNEICSEIDWPLGHGLLIDDGGKRIVSTGVWHTSDLELKSQLSQQIDQLHFEMGEEIPGEVWQRGQAVWRVQPFQSDRYDELQRLGAHVASTFAIPVFVEGNVAAVLEFFHNEERRRSSDVIEAARSIVSEISRFLERRSWQRERSYLAAIVESSSDAVIGKDRDGKIVSWNEGAERIYGYAEDESIGKSIRHLLPDGFEEEEDELLRVIESGKKLASFETRRRHKSGKLLEISMTLSPIRDAQGKLIGTATIERDITPIKTALRDFHDREEKLRLLMDASGEAIYGVDTEGICTFANRACAKTLGFESANELLGSKMHPIVHHTRVNGAPYPIEDCPIHQTFTEGKSVHVSNEVFWKTNGKSFPVEYWSSPIRRGNEIVGAVIVFEDATERIEADRTRAELAAIVESSGDAIIGKALDGTIKSWNRGAEKLYGYTAFEMTGQPYSILAADQQDEKQSPIDFPNSSETVTRETTRCHRDGHVIDVGITESAIRNSYGDLIGTASIERDISLRKRREEELEEATVAAEIANRTKSEFLANISHELRTPMNAVLGMLQIVLEERLPSAIKDYLATAYESAETLLLLLNDLLDFSRMEAGRFELDPEPFSLREVIDGAMKTLAMRAHEKGLEIGVSIERDVPDHLYGDGFRFRQVLTNLAGNAIKFTDHGEVVVSVKSERIQQNRIRLHCAIRDTGVGIPEVDLQKIFEPFTQVDSSSTRARAGTGLGLAICRELVSKMQGSISAESNLGVGTRLKFHVEFNVLAEVEPGAEVRELAGLQALIIDDNMTNRQILSSLLSNWSMEVQSATGAEEAMGLVEGRGNGKNNFSLAIVDSVMPERDGAQLIEELRKKGNQLPIILMVSPKDRLAYEKRCQELGVTAYLEKPVSQSDVLDAVMTTLRGPQLSWSSFEAVEAKASRRLRLLVAEDTPANQKVVRAILERRGHEIVLAANGREAIQLAQSERFDVVLMDVQMPLMDGIQATQAIRKGLDNRTASVPIIAMTAHARREDRHRCLKAGMDGYLSKPINAAKMIDLVERFARKGRLAKQKKSKADEQRVQRKENTAVIDLDIALKRMGGDKEILDELKDAFIMDAPDLVEQIETAIQESDNEQAHRASHSLKGLAANFEAIPLVDSAKRIEKAAKNGDLQAARANLLQTRRELTRVIEALQAE